MSRFLKVTKDVAKASPLPPLIHLRKQSAGTEKRTGKNTRGAAEGIDSFAHPSARDAALYAAPFVSAALSLTGPRTRTNTTSRAEYPKWQFDSFLGALRGASKLLGQGLRKLVAWQKRMRLLHRVTKDFDVILNRSSILCILVRRRGDAERQSFVAVRAPDPCFREDE